MRPLRCLPLLFLALPLGAMQPAFDGSTPTGWMHVTTNQPRSVTAEVVSAQPDVGWR